MFFFAGLTCKNLLIKKTTLYIVVKDFIKSVISKLSREITYDAD
ncbi:protein of unknown function [Maridesulfovibrio hydrothermalis AM13 = DSM 14728]|uniref:Uncharacterized protein n=1 Tax=Maridesulfovibrio hydrothermalis AM13 = DSM 14728 TaxID=1121451 RepID=L0RAA0_9BACT|nr:protein of unknown function [Maridesulfovibrio hydrothermalis AM13 = DSM 14728]